MMSINRTRRWFGVPIALAALAMFAFGGVAAQEEAPETPPGQEAPEQEAPEQDVTGALAALPDAQQFATAFATSAVADALNEDATYTVFVPTDAALEAAGVEFMSADDVLAYVVEGTYLSAELEDMANAADAEPLVLTSLAGTEIVVDVGQPGDVVLDERAVIALPDHGVGNLTIHTIHDVLGEPVAAE